MLRSPALLVLLVFMHLQVCGQERTNDPVKAAVATLTMKGIRADDLGELRIADSYVDARTGIRHTWLRQQWQGIDIFNSEVAVHQNAAGEVVAMVPQVVEHVAEKAGSTEPGISPSEALRIVLTLDAARMPIPAMVQQDPARHRWYFAGAAFSGERPFVELVWVRAGDALLLAWNVNYYMPYGSHWWNVRIDANTGKELERNDWVESCAFGAEAFSDGQPTTDNGQPLPPPSAPNDYRVYPYPVESPNHGARALRNAPWTLAPIASPYGWHDTNGAPGAEYTITRGNNVYASEDVNMDNLPGYSPNSATLDFDFALNLGNAPSTYQDAAITNLFYWDNLMHDVFYRYGFDEVSGNFQSNNYGRGGAQNDHVNADAQDGLGTNNANFVTPPDGTSPRQQMFKYTFTTPNRDSDLDAGVVTHEYGHGISRRLVGGPSNSDCLDNQEAMNEGWSDYFSLMMTMEPGDLGTDGRGCATYLVGQPVTGLGVRPYRYSTDPAINSLTYASSNNSSLLPNSHGVGVVWCTMLWDLTWDLIDLYGFSTDLYNGTAGNNIALQLVVDGLKYTACGPGFVDGRDAILQADQINNGGAYQNLIWSAFAARGLGFSASQGSSWIRFDQVEAFDMPTNINVGVRSSATPAPGSYLDCQNGLPVTLNVRNNGLTSQGNFNVNYRVDGGAVITQLFSGTLLPSFTTPVTFATALTLTSYGPHTIKAWTSLATDQYHVDDTLTFTVNWQANVTLPFSANAEDGLALPTGWSVQNTDGLYTWANANLAMGANCAATKAYRMNYYTYFGIGQEDRLVSPQINLAGNAGTHLQFHHAYAQRSTYNDGLRVEISTDCGTNWITLYTASGAALATAPSFATAWVPTACNQWLLHDIDLGAYDGKTVLLRFTGICGFGNDLFLDNITLVNNGLKLSLKMLLDGPYDSNTLTMRDDLRAAGSLPGAEPYTVLGFTQASDGGGEVLQGGVASTIGNNAIVDWVQVELRNALTPATIVATRAALVQRDGDVVDVDGVSPIAMLATAGSYHVTVRHRDHFGVMTAAPIALSTSATSMDFTNTATLTYGVAAQKQVGTKMMLWAGDANGDGTLKYTGTNNDRDQVLTAIGGVVPTNTLPNVYDRRDVNMDGTVKYTGAANDRDIILQNIGGVVPTNTRTQQLP